MMQALTGLCTSLRHAGHMSSFLCNGSHYAERATAPLLLLGALLLALEPALWLVRTWYAPGYEGWGSVAFGLTVVLVVWSRMSPLGARGTAGVGVWPWWLLIATSVIRLAAQLLDVNVIGALVLCVDVYALARLAQLDLRVRPVSAFWLAVLFAFSLPVEPMLQRVAGYALQVISSQIGCGLLWPWLDGLTCDGVRLRLEGRDVFVDLPCSGAELLSLSAMVLAGMHALSNPPWRRAVLGTALWFLLALLGNGARVAVLAMGIGYGSVVGIDVMAPVPHTAIGLLIVAVVNGGLYLGLRRLYARAADRPAPRSVGSRQRCPVWRAALSRMVSFSAIQRLTAAFAFVVFALAVGAIQPRPLDASVSLTPPPAPMVVAGLLGTAGELSPQEQIYFTRFGGGAQRVSYGPFGLLLVTTASPLRHLHDPTLCMGAMGYQVRLLGTDHATDTTVYEAVDEGGYAYRVHVSYVDAHGTRASSVAQVVWHWLEGRGGVWTMVQRIVPADATPESKTWLAGVRRAFNLV